MRIEQNQSMQKLLMDIQKEKTITEKETKVVVKANKEDEFQFNVSANELNKFFELANKANVVREEKVEKIMEKIQNGQYQVSGKDILSKVLEEKANGAIYN